MAVEKAKEIDLGGDLGAVFLKINGVRLEVAPDGKRIKVAADSPVDISIDGNVNLPKPPVASTAAKRALFVGDQMADGTVVVAVDKDRNIALFAPEGIFAGKAGFHSQDAVAETANTYSLHGHKDWRRVADREASALAKEWNKFAPPSLQGTGREWFWGAAGGPTHYNGRPLEGRAYVGATTRWHNFDAPTSFQVPVVRSGPARG